MPASLADLAGRILLSVLFLVSGIGKIGGYAATQGYMELKGVPGALLPLVIALEVGGPLLLIIGFQTRIVALALAGFSLVAAFLFHVGGDQMQQIMLLKDIAIAGGFLIIAAHGAGTFSLDARRRA